MSGFMYRNGGAVDLKSLSIKMVLCAGAMAVTQPASAQDRAHLSNMQGLSSVSQRGAAVFAANCAVCHGPDGKGMRAMGPQNLTDASWLYGGDKATIVQTVTNSRYGVMPAWGPRLDAVTAAVLQRAMGGAHHHPHDRPAGPGQTRQRQRRQEQFGESQCSEH